MDPDEQQLDDELLDDALDGELGDDESLLLDDEDDGYLDFDSFEDVDE